MTAKPQAPAAERNKQPILEVLRQEFRDSRSVLEIGSGTGQHAVYFAREMPWLTWQTSDLAENHQDIKSWIVHSGLPNLRDPMRLDVESPGDIDAEYDGVFSANTAHIMSIRAVQCMFEIVGQVLSSRGLFCLYGPFNQHGESSSESNRSFDESLRRRDPAMGIRDLDELDRFAGASAMRRERLYAMPTNNLIAIWRKQEFRNK